ncbi:MAG TPA: type II toxin-antitoxin system VapC family toxin [Planctomycetaceae bacterium]|nr:type II toxin-antitoxin system VapC family toxin [Planctomycetaceae bacterium]
MRLFVLDTDMLTLLQHGHSEVCDNVDAHNEEDLVICVITVEEQLSGWYTVLRQAKSKEKLARAYSQLAACVESLSDLRVLHFTEACIDRFEQLRATGVPVKKMDLRIAAAVLEFGGTLVTRNVRDFSQIPGLTIEDWSRPPTQHS